LPEEDTDYFSKCWQPDDVNNTNLFCSSKFADEKDRINCATDLCYLCCDVRDVMFNKSHTISSLQSCKKRCLNEHSNIKEDKDKKENSEKPKN
jgi:hypothetical protein